MNQKKLRIAMLSAHSCPVGDLGARDTGGMSVYIRELARELGKMGHTVDIFTRIHDPADPVMEYLYQSVRLIHLQAGRKATINKIDVYHSLPEFMRNLEEFWFENHLKYDIVFSHYWISALAAKNIWQKYGVPYMAMYHTLGAIKNAIGIGSDEPSLRIASEKLTITDSRKIIVATEKEKQDIVYYYDALPQKISIVPCGVNMDLFCPHDKKVSRQVLGLLDKKTVLYVGRIDPLKGIDRLIESLSLIKNNHDIRLVIIGGDAGSHSEVEKLQKLAVGLGIDENVVFKGLVKQDILPLYYSAADVCAVPSYYESFGLVPLESLACGTPVVATEVGDLKNIIRQNETGIVIPDNTSEKIAEALYSVFLGFPVKPDYAMHIRATVSRWNWANIAYRISQEMQMALDAMLMPAGEPSYCSNL